MSMIKRLMEEQEQRGHTFLEDKYVCKECIGDYAIKEFIDQNLEEKYCDYCGKKTSKLLISTNINNVLDLIAESIRYEWDDPNNEMGWDTREGGWQGATVIDTYDLVIDELELEIENDDLLNDIIYSINDQQSQWCESDPYSLREHQELMFDWKEFSRQVMHKVRHVFFKVKFQTKYSVEPEPYRVLDYIKYVINSLDLIKFIPKGTIFYRARMHNYRIKYKTVKELGPPTEENAKYSNRMSPAGIPMFYGAQDELTAINEVKDNLKRYKYVTIAQFKTLSKLLVLDLTKIPRVPSLFDRNNRIKRQVILFLHGFLKDFMKEISKDGREHIEYVPTQVVTEYLRYLYRYKKSRINGILYPSSVSQNGTSVVLFLGSENCINDNDPITNDPINKEKKKLLAFIQSSIRKVKVL